MRYSRRNHQRRRMSPTAVTNHNSLVAFPKFYLFNLAPTAESSKWLYWLYAIILLVSLVVFLEKNLGLFGFIDSFVTMQTEFRINEHQTFIQEGIFQKRAYISDSEQKVCILLEPETTIIVQIKDYTMKFFSKYFS